MGEKAIKGKAITKVLSCLVVFAILMSTFSVAVIATNSANSTASNVNVTLNLNLNDEANSSVESISGNITSKDQVITIHRGSNNESNASIIQINHTSENLNLNSSNAINETAVNESGSSDLPDASNTSSPGIINESDEVPDPDLPVINDTDIEDTAKTVSSTSSCSYVWIKITDKYCYGYKVYVDGVYQFKEDGDGYCSFKVTPGYHTFKLTLNGKEVSNGWNCRCGVVYNWVSMNDMIPHWCEDDGGNCDNPPTVSFDKSTYYEGDTVHITVHNPISGQVVDYEIIDCEGNSKELKALPYGTSSIYYTLPTVSSCCYWKICFYWNEGQPPLGAGSYCTKCYSFYVCPPETPCKVWVSVEDKYCKGYGVYVDGVYQFTEGESGTPDGYCRFHVTPGTHKFELRKDGCSVSKSWYCQCGTSYRWISMNDMDPHWCECNKPDLVVQDIWWSPSNPKEGDTVTFTAKTKNQGSGNAGGFYVCYYVDGSYYARDYVSSLSAGSTTTTSFSWTAKCGSHAIKAVTDCYSDVEESNEGNNARTEYINIVCKPDLVVQDISWSPSNPKLDDTVTINVKTKNQGSENAGGFYVGYYVDGSYYDRDYVSSLSAGSTTTTSFTWIVDCGNHAIKAVADCYDAVAESDEENNWMSKGGLNIPCNPDLIIQDIYWSPSNPKQGDTVTINVKTKNQGSGNTGGFYVCYYVDGFYYDRDYVSSLSDGSTTTTSFTWTADCGNHAIKAVADCYDAVTESDEENNWRSKGGLNIPCKSDLIIQDISLSPSNPKEGETVTFTVKTKNQGSENAGGFYVGYYVDGSYYDRDYVSSLSAGSTTTTSFSWTADCGNHAIKAVADCYSDVEESNEGNNDRTEYINIPCKPDLIVQDISWSPSNPTENDRINFSARITNQGNADAKSCLIKFSIPNVYAIAEEIPRLNAGESKIVEVKGVGVKLPCGYYTLIATVDSNDDIDESNEGNNQRIETVNIVCPKIPAFESKGIYVWGFSTEFFKNENERERFFNLIKNDGIKTAFLSIDESLFADPACKEFVKEANENLQVHAMIGANWSAGDADKIDPFVRAVLKYNAENPDYMFSGIHLDAEPRDYPLKDFLGEYKEKLIDMKTRLNYNGETISSQKMALSIDVGCWWANEPNDLKDLIGVPDLDYITIMAYRDNATDIIGLANKVTSIAQEKGKPFVISLETQEGVLKDGDFKPDQPVTFFEEGQCELQQELEKLEENYKDDELFKGFAIHYYQSSFTPWHIITDVIWPSGEFNIGDSVKVIVKLRTSDNFNERPVGIGLSVRDKKGNVYPDNFLGLGLDKDTSKIILMGGEDEKEVELTWRVPKVAEEGWYDITVAAWDIDLNEAELHESTLLKNYPEVTEIGMYKLYKMNIAGLRKPCVELCRRPLYDSWREDQFKVCKPDLIVQDISWDKGSPKQGDTITFYVKVKNQGSGSAGTSTVKYYIDGSYVGSDTVPSLSVGSTSTQTFTWKANKCGNVQVKAIADATNAVDESNEDNNERSEIFEIPCEKPDLIIQDISWEPKNPNKGDTVTFTAIVKNQGPESTGKATFIKYFVDGTLIDTGLVPALSGGSTSTQKFTWTANKCGDVLVKVVADYWNDVEETNEENNERTETVNIICLYLERIWITGPDEIKAGETLQWQAYGSYSDGSQKELTSRVSWTIDHSDILQNKGNGKFKGLKGGEATLKITYEGKSASKKVTVIEKTNQPPKASFTYEKDGLTVRFTSTSSDPDGDIETYSWFFGDGGTSNQKNPIHTYSSEGTYTVVLIVWDDKGKPGSDSEDITVTEPKVPIKVTVKNINNYPLPGCGGEITVKAHTDIHGKSLEEGSASYYGGEKDLTITLNVPTKTAKCITVWQTPKIKDGVQEYWGAMALTPEKKKAYNFVRDTPWITSVTINGKSPYNELIDLNSPGWKTFHVQVTNPQIVNRKVKVEAFLDRDEKTPWDFNSNDLQELAPKESKEFRFFYNKEQTEGIWRFRIVVGMYSLDEKYVVTDQHDWYMIVDKGLLDREFYLGITAQSYYVFISQDADEALDETIGDTVELYNSLVIGDSEDVAKESLLQAIKDYDAVLGGLFEAYTSINDLIHFAENVQKILNNIMIATDLQLIKRTGGYSNAEKYSSDLGSCDGIQERVKCWKSGDEEAIEDMLTKEGQYLTFMQGFADSAKPFMNTEKVRQQLDDFSNSCSKQYRKVKGLYYEVVNHNPDKYNDFKVKSNWYSKANP